MNSAALFVLLVVLLLAGCASQEPYRGFSETQLESALRGIHDRLGYDTTKIRDELSASEHYTAGQAAELKRRIIDLIIAYEKLYDEAACPQRKDSRVCWETQIRSAGFRYNSGILDAEHPDLPALPKRAGDWR
jgi:hypothetical protein